MKIERLKTNHVTNPMGFVMEKPTFSWTVTESTGKHQASAQIRVSKDAAMEQIVHDSGRQEDISSLAYLCDMQLQPCTRYFWNVEVWADNGDHGVSDTAWFETALMDKPWQGEWIRAPFDAHPVFEKEVVASGAICSARLYICGLGVYEAYINGDKVGDEYLAPFFTSYNHHIQYQTYDVTDQLSAGSNTLSVMLGRGWYHGRFGFGDPLDKIYGKTMQLIAELHITYADGRKEIIPTDESWLCRTSPVVESNIYDGEKYDASRSSRAVQAVLADAPEGTLCPRLSLPVTKQVSIPDYVLLHTPKGELVLDFGQVITGWVEFDADKDVKLQYGELLQQDCFYNENLRSAKAEYTYYADGNMRHVRPHFTFYGFRYVKVTGLSEEDIRNANFIAYGIWSALENTGSIETSNEKVNRLIANAVWSQRDNFLDVPTDCPQRDERMGWTGDAQVFASTASFNMDTAAFFRKYLYDMLLEQKDNSGSVPHVVPDVLTARAKAEGKVDGEVNTGMGGGSCAWGDAATIIPWTMYQYYGDKGLLEENYDNMRAWVEFIYGQDEQNCGGSRLWSSGFHFADWLALDNPIPNIPLGGTDHTYVATAYYFWSALLTSKAATVLGKTEDAERYQRLAEQVKTAFQNAYFEADGALKITTQTAHTLALHFGLAPDEYREAISMGLKAKLDSKNIHLDTGFVGTGMLCDALSQNGLNDYAHTLLLNEDFPSWLYEVNMGATTIWERWNSVLPDGSVSDTGMNSMNHYAYGAVLGWMYRTMAGLNVNAPGWKKARIAPMPDRRFDYVRAHYDSAAGRYESSWHRQRDEIRYEIKVPFDAEAEFVVPEGCTLVSVNGAAVSGQCLTLEQGRYTIVTR